MLGRAEKSSCSYHGSAYETVETFQGTGRWVKTTTSCEYNWGPQEVTRTLSHNGFGEVEHYAYSGPDPTGTPQAVERRWVHDGVGNWECFTGDFPGEDDSSDAGGHTWCYNRRQEIGAITAKRHVREYRQAGRKVLDVPVDYRQGALDTAFSRIVAASRQPCK